MNTTIERTTGAGLAAATCSPFFIFDVESVGLHGEGFAVAGGVYLANGAAQWEFGYACPIDEAKGDDEGRKWVKANVPTLDVTHRLPIGIRDAFWRDWLKAKAQLQKEPDGVIPWIQLQSISEATGRLLYAAGHVNALRLAGVSPNSY